MRLEVCIRIEISSDMKNSVELFENLPSDGVYKGKGRVSFTRPDGEVRGNTTVTVSPTGDVSVTMEVEEFDIPPEYGKFGAFSLMPFLDGSLPQQQGGDRVVFAQRAGQHRSEERR